jgi:hypothetical protein
MLVAFLMAVSSMSFSVNFFGGSLLDALQICLNLLVYFIIFLVPFVELLQSIGGAHVRFIIRVDIVIYD